MNKEYIHLGIRETGTKSTSNHSTEILTFSWRFCRWLRAVLTRSLREKITCPRPTSRKKEAGRTLQVPQSKERSGIPRYACFCCLRVTESLGKASQSSMCVRFSSMGWLWFSCNAECYSSPCSRVCVHFFHITSKWLPTICCSGTLPTRWVWASSVTRHLFHIVLNL